MYSWLPLPNAWYNQVIRYLIIRQQKNEQTILRCEAGDCQLTVDMIANVVLYAGLQYIFYMFAINHGKI